MGKPFYLTTTLPYVNAEPHIGFALEIVQADALARARKILGDEVFFNTGTDEHGLKIYRKAREEGENPQAYVDRYAEKFRNLKEMLDLSDDLRFIRTTDVRHVRAAQEFWKRCDANGYVYKKDYRVKYCVGCELEKTDSELVDGRCPIHPNLDVETINEENYFFRWSTFQEKLLTLYRERPDFVVPASRLNEIRSFVERGLEDFSISRLREKMPWGIPVPGDEAHVMYVWFDALVNYVSTLGWPDDVATFEKFWGTADTPNAVQVAGKDNLRQQTAMWQAMLMAAGLPTSKQVVIHGFITSGGEKMSKSVGNVIDPVAIVEEYGADALRYYLLRHISPFEDSDFTVEKFKEAYNGNLVNGLGNVVARVMKLAEVNLPAPVTTDSRAQSTIIEMRFGDHLKKYEINKAIDEVWDNIADLDGKVTTREPFKLIKENPEEGRKVIRECVDELHTIGLLLAPFLPRTSEMIREAVYANKKPENLFPRKA